MRGKLTEEEISKLRNNQYVADVTDTKIIYTNEFKFLFMKQYNEGKKPTQIFREAGFDPKILGVKRIERAAARWRASYASGGLGKGEAHIAQNERILIDQLKAEIVCLKAELSKYQKQEK